jgi:hypothetical protein
MKPNRRWLSAMFFTILPFHGTLLRAEEQLPTQEQEVQRLRCEALPVAFEKIFQGNFDEAKVLRLLDEASTCIAEGLLSKVELNNCMRKDRQLLLEEALARDFAYSSLNKMQEYFEGQISLAAVSRGAQKYQAMLPDLLDNDLVAFPDEFPRQDPPLNHLDELIAVGSMVSVTDREALIAKYPYVYYSRPFNGEYQFVSKIRSPKTGLFSSENPTGKIIRIGEHSLYYKVFNARWYQQDTICDIKVHQLFWLQSLAHFESKDKNALVALFDLGDDAVTAAVLHKPAVRALLAEKFLLIHYMMHGNSPHALKAIYQASADPALHKRAEKISVIKLAMLAKMPEPMLIALAEEVPVASLREPLGAEIYYKATSWQGKNALELAKIRGLDNLLQVMQSRLQ